jgi:hypothetical protein
VDGSLTIDMLLVSSHPTTCPSRPIWKLSSGERKKDSSYKYQTKTSKTHSVLPVQNQACINTLSGQKLETRERQMSELLCEEGSATMRFQACRALISASLVTRSGRVDLTDLAGRMPFCSLAGDW